MITNIKDVDRDFIYNDIDDTKRIISGSEE